MTLFLSVSGTEVPKVQSPNLSEQSLRQVIVLLLTVSHGSCPILSCGFVGPPSFPVQVMVRTFVFILHPSVLTDPLGDPLSVFPCLTVSSGPRRSSVVAGPLLSC